MLDIQDTGTTSSTAIATPFPRPSPSSPDAPLHALDYDLAIVGGGIVGLTLACALTGEGLRIALIEARPKSESLSQRRAYAMTLLSGRIFEGLGLWSRILPQITTFQTIRLAEADCPAVVNLQPDDLGTAALGYVAEHRVLAQELHQRLEQEPDITWLCPADLLHVVDQPDGVELTISQDGEQQTLRAKLLVAADGSRSPIRQRAGIDTVGWTYWQSCVTAVIRPEKSHENIAREHFWPSGPFATLPLTDNRCQIVLTAPHAEAERLLNVEERAFLEELNRRYDHQLGSLELVSDRALFPVKLMHSRAYVRPRLALVGDAAHSCHPVGGQGLNLGIRDAAALAQVILAAHRSEEDIGTLSVLKRYERWRSKENWLILAFTDLLDRFFSNVWFPILPLRRLGLRIMGRVQVLRHLALRLMTGLSGRSLHLASCSPKHGMQILRMHISGGEE